MPKRYVIGVMSFLFLMSLYVGFVTFSQDRSLANARVLERQNQRMNHGHPGQYVGTFDSNGYHT